MICSARALPIAGTFFASSRYTLQFTSLDFIKVHFGRFDLTLRGARERDGRAIALLRVRRAVPAIEGGVQLERRALARDVREAAVVVVGARVVVDAEQRRGRRVDRLALRLADEC